MVPGGHLKVFADYWGITLDDMVSTGRYISSMHTCLYYDRFGKHETNGVVARIVRMIIDTDGVLVVGNVICTGRFCRGLEARIRAKDVAQSRSLIGRICSMTRCNQE